MPNKNIYLYNTLTHKKQKFEPIKKEEVTMYSCGPTVYDFAHIGNFRSFLFSDLLTRVFRYAGYKIIKIQNITDVGHLTNDDIADSSGEDKITKKAKQEKKDPFEIARFFEEKFIEDEKLLRIIPPKKRPRATEFIPEQIDLIQKLIEKNFAYERNGSVYFRTNKFPNYGILSGNKLENLLAGARIEKNPEKENFLDFALWKKAPKNHLMQWDSPWGKGFPGWHIECSAMSKKLFGQCFDIHTGGEDNIFPHHECEIAQNECSNDDNFENGKFVSKKISINFWLHTKHLLVNGEKMSKSKNNFFTIRDLHQQGWKGEEIRYILISAHYRKALNFTIESLQDARNTIEKLIEAKRIFTNLAKNNKKILKNNFFTNADLQKFYKKFQEALFDDLNIPEALASVFEIIKWGLKKRDEKNLSPELAAQILFFLENDFQQIFDIFPEEKNLSQEKINQIENLIAQRNKHRQEKNFAEADKIRDKLLKEKILLIDEAEKTNWKILKKIKCIKKIEGAVT